MSNLQRDIGSEPLKITDIIERLRKDEFLIPTFQRDFVWQPENIRKLWDSIYRFYPVGSLLYWETDSYLHTHRKLGGFDFPHDEDTIKKFKEWKYILDGQQRATSLLVSFLGGTGRVEGNENFDYTMYFDATKGEFFFAGDLENRKKGVKSNFLVRLRDVPEWGFTFYKDVSAVVGFNSTIEHNLQQLANIFTNYKIAVVRIKGVEVSEVCEIFERINQEGKKLHPVDIIVARTYRPENPAKKDNGFYLRDNLSELRELLVESGNRFKEIDDLNFIQMFALCLRKGDVTANPPKRSAYGITPAALDNLKTADFESQWGNARKSILDTVKMLSDFKIQGPGMLPTIYLMLTLAYYLHCNRKPNRSIARQWFWRTAFDVDDIGNSTELYTACEDFFGRLEKGEVPQIKPLVVSRENLIQTSYNYRNTLSRAVLAFLASQNPRDFSDPQAEVLDNVYLQLSQAPNLHHIYPLNFLKGVKDLPKGSDANSLMNICYLRALTNIRIGDKNPLTYFQDFKNQPGFAEILQSHMIPAEFINCDQFKPADYGDFLNARAQQFALRLKAALPDVEVKITD
jgi:hypothetical protein